MTSFMKEPCAHCPFRRDVRPFLHVERAEDIAYSAQNPYSEFLCHKTIEHDDETGEGIATRKSLTCAGFLSMQINEAGVKPPRGFKVSELAYDNCREMIDAYCDEEEGNWKPPAWLLKKEPAT
ncbi:hypothetical protein FHT87_005234 [Rhizobium sp. BK316]|uniref:DUF6283 family protein n=1 Tax=Rhizobium sp. BK316 TaxID=2587053 RepID=UPI00160E71FA|nr:DUF6283 family protein [Rhizobium sp. BK316]MBB3411281.1 hypothetical protein [Rhizobium sp. BK316]